MSNRSGQAALVVLAVILIALGAAYYVIGIKAQNEIDALWVERQAARPALVVEDTPTTGQGPFHLAIRYGNETLAKLVEESVSRRMATAPRAMTFA